MLHLTNDPFEQARAFAFDYGVGIGTALRTLRHVAWDWVEAEFLLVERGTLLASHAPAFVRTEYRRWTQVAADDAVFVVELDLMTTPRRERWSLLSGVNTALASKSIDCKREALLHLAAAVADAGGKLTFRTIMADGSRRGIEYAHAAQQSRSLLLVDVNSDALGKPLVVNVLNATARQVLANRPTFVDRDEVPRERLAQMTRLISAELALKRKPTELWSTLSSDKFDAFFARTCLLQSSMLGPHETTTVDARVRKVAAIVGTQIQIVGFGYLS